jgi:predicted esterase
VTDLLVLLHGHGDDPAGLVALGRALDPDGRRALLVPSGRLDGGTGPAWLPGDDPHAVTADLVRASLAALAAELIAAGGGTVTSGDGDAGDTSSLVLGGPDAGATSAIVLGGFSQGAAVALAYALARRRGPTADWPRPDHVVVFGSFLLPPDVVDYDPGGAEATRWWLGHGADDEVVPLPQGRSAARWLGRHDLDVTWHETPGGHAVPAAQVDAARAWLEARES